MKAILVFEDGSTFDGTAFGERGTRFGEAIFNTSMTGYQEILSDPSYAGQIVVMTAPQIGNTGTNDDDDEAEVVQARGLVVRELSLVPSSWRTKRSLPEYMSAHGVVGIQGVDTRAVTRVLRDKGAQRAGISTELSAEELLKKVREIPSMDGQDLASDVTCDAPVKNTWQAWQSAGVHAESAAALNYRVVAIDFGIKRNILRRLRSVGCDVTVVPASTSAKEILDLKPHGVFLSNGPGDPATLDYAIETVKELLTSKLPIFGICLGHQILALALGARTYKLEFGHHGGNHPILDEALGRVDITAQNHGFAVDPKSLPEGVVATHWNLYDKTLAGIESGQAFGVQYHPEASPGPHDARHLFERFATNMKRNAH